jgi:hypothetical protein
MQVNYCLNYCYVRDCLQSSIELPFPPDLAHPDHPAISIRVSSDAKIAESEDGSYLDVAVQNHLPCVSNFSCHLHQILSRVTGTAGRSHYRRSSWPR